MPKKSSQKTRILFAAGGTGGHIFPAIAVRDALLQLDPDVETLFVCGSRPLEIELYRREGVEPLILDLQPLRPGIAGKSCGLLKLVLGFLKALSFLRKWKPDRVMGQGGYATAPVLLAARILRIPYDLQEQNSVPGRTNRWFAAGADRVFCSFRGAVERLRKASPKSHPTCSRMPLRTRIVRKDEKETSRRFFDLDPPLPVLLVIGGSQGARGLNEKILESLRIMDRDPRGAPPFQCLWSVGERNMNWLEGELRSRPLERIPVKPVAFIQDMGKAYSAADLAVSRAGAGAVFELMACGVPSIFVPLPHAKDDHQKHNAGEAVETGAAILMEEKRLDAESLAFALKDLLENPGKRATMKEAAKGFGSDDAALFIAGQLLKKK